ncbi:MAG: bifunctional riboflavin kinase/FMN adenylyltransferase [Micavibrio sp.]|nr:bifunctional riboflavin kinase/FMN adenylyltransferase [Micavibrio sp.]|tara:strand:+ start:5649 stop:6575 length:927 start_codon:yes stop_codon:yes gene_type:complete
MNILTSLSEIPENARGAVVVIGNFDGVHKGHQALLQKGAEIAKSKELDLAVLTFEPHPRSLFRSDDPPTRITPPALKAERLAIHGVNHLYSLEFNWDFASQTADAFIENILKQGLGAAHIVVGDDFQFGQMRKGTIETLEKAGFEVSAVNKIASQEGEIYSSSLIRQSLRHGKIERANEILGWDWEMRGIVVKGDQRGRELGFPTANVALGDTVHPAYGVYATLTRIEGEDVWHASATNIGIRPMFEIPTAQIETYIFDFDRDIYDQVIHVRPVKRLRSEAKFNSLDELIAQMNEDCAQAREILKPLL